jgi:hypothetical protein
MTPERARIEALEAALIDLLNRVCALEKAAKKPAEVRRLTATPPNMECLHG